MLGVFEPRELNYYTLFRLIPLTLYISRNLTSIYLLLSGSLDSLLCNSMAPNSDLVFFLLMSQTLSGGVIIFVKQGLFFSELSTSSLSSLGPYSDYVEVNISLNASSSLSFLNVYAPPIRYFTKDCRTNFFSLSILPSYVEAEAVDFLRFRFHRKSTASTASSFRFRIPGLSKITGSQRMIWRFGEMHWREDA